MLRPATVRGPDGEIDLFLHLAARLTIRASVLRAHALLPFFHADLNSPRNRGKFPIPQAVPVLEHLAPA